jgi:hypothetical protein
MYVDGGAPPSTGGAQAEREPGRRGGGGGEFAEDLQDDVEVWLLVAFDGVDVGFCSNMRRSER